MLMIWLTLEVSMRIKSLLIRPFHPLRMPMQSMPRPRAERTTARMAAFIPGASPPLVKTPIRFTCFSICFLQFLVVEAAPAQDRTEAASEVREGPAWKLSDQTIPPPRPGCQEVLQKTGAWGLFGTWQNG